MNPYEVICEILGHVVVLLFYHVLLSFLFGLYAFVFYFCLKKEECGAELVFKCLYVGSLLSVVFVYLTGFPPF